MFVLLSHLLQLCYRLGSSSPLHVRVERFSSLVDDLGNCAVTNTAHFRSVGRTNRLALEIFKRTLEMMRSRFAFLVCVFVQEAKIRNKSQRCSSILMPSGTLRERPRHRPVGQYCRIFYTVLHDVKCQNASNGISRPSLLKRVFL